MREATLMTMTNEQEDPKHWLPQDTRCLCTKAQCWYHALAGQLIAIYSNLYQIISILHNCIWFYINFNRFYIKMYQNIIKYIKKYQIYLKISDLDVSPNMRSKWGSYLLWKELRKWFPPSKLHHVILMILTDPTMHSYTSH